MSFKSLMFLGVLGYASTCMSSEFEYNLDIAALYDRVENLPSGRQLLEGGSVWANYGIDWQPDTETIMQFSVAGRSAASTDNRKNEFTFLENEKAEGDRLTRLSWDLALTNQQSLSFGRKPLSVELSPLIWDKDLSVDGGHYTYIKNSDFMQFKAQLSGFKTDDIYDVNASSQVFDLQWTFFGDDSNSRIGLWWVSFSDLENAKVVKRQNDSEPLLNDDFTILGGNVGYSHRVGSFQLNWDVTVLENMSLENEHRAHRIDFSAVPDWSSYSINYAFQEVDKNAVVAAFNDDDWWFASWMSGHRLSLSIQLSENQLVDLSYFDEKLKVRDDRLTRFMVLYKISII